SPIGLLALAFQTRTGGGGHSSVAASAATRVAIPATSTGLLRPGSSRRLAYVTRLIGQGTGRRRASGTAGAPCRKSGRPDVEIVDVVAHVAAVPPEARTGSGGAHRLELAGAEPEIECGLFGREERAALPGPRRPGDFVFHGTLAQSGFVAAPVGRPSKCPAQCALQRLECDAPARSSPRA